MTAIGPRTEYNSLGANDDDIAPFDAIETEEIRNSLVTGQFGRRIAVLGDSMSAQSALYDEMWPVVLDRVLNQNGVQCQVRSFSINAHTAYRMLSTANFGDLTAVEACVEYKPDIVLIVTGFNDAYEEIDGRTLTQIVQDVADVIAAVKLALPNCLVLYGTQYPYDTDNFTPATLLNKGAAPATWNLTTAGPLISSYTAEFANTAILAASVTKYTKYDNFNSQVIALPELDGSFNMYAWKVARLGLLTTDGLHFSRMGHVMLAGYALKTLLLLPDFQVFADTFSPQLVTSWIDPEEVFDQNLTPSGDGYVTANPDIVGAEVISSNQSYARMIRPDQWFHQYKAEVTLRSVGDPVGNTISVSLYTAQGLYQWRVQGACPNTPIFLAITSVFSGGFFPSGESTNNMGDFFNVAAMPPLAAGTGMALGAQEFRFKVANDVFGPFALDLVT